MKVKTQDFQILKGENIFEFPVGITVIQGKTGSGKTSLFYAIQDCLLNPAGVDDSINWDAKNCAVTISNNNNEITWIKTNTSSQYIDEKTQKEYVKASKLDSTDLADLGFYIKDNDVVNIQDEWKLLFPFGLKDTEMFRLFEDIFNISCSFLVIDEYKKEEQQIKSNINQTVATLNDLTRKRVILENIFSNIDSTKIQNLIHTMQKKEKESTDIIDDLQKFIDFSTYKNIDILPEFNSNNLNSISYTYNTIINDYDEFSKNKLLLDMDIFSSKEFNLCIPPIIQDYDQCKNVIQELKNYEQTLNELNQKEDQIRAQLKQIKVCPTCGKPLD